MLWLITLPTLMLIQGTLIKLGAIKTQGMNKGGWHVRKKKESRGSGRGMGERNEGGGKINLNRTV